MVEQTKKDEPCFLEQAMVLLARMRDSIGTRHFEDMRERARTYLAQASEAELYQLAVQDLRSRGVSGDAELLSAVRKLRGMRDKGIALLKRCESGGKL